MSPAAPVDATIDAADAAHLLLAGAGLLEDPGGRAGPTRVRATIRDLGFVQVDSISVAARAHDHVLMSRIDDYRPEHLVRLLERERACFEHWTHDASIVPIEWYPHWGVRFARARTIGPHRNPWWTRRLGPDPDGIVARVEAFVAERGPVPTRALAALDPPHEGRRQAWWSWSPAKAAAEYLWRCGVLAVAHRVAFEKTWDLAARVFPDHHESEPPDDAAHLEWACRAAFERLGVATPTEAAKFLNAVDHRAAGRWCRDATARGELVPVAVRDAGDPSRARPALARHDWRERLARTPAPPAEARLLSPFDPALRERDRAERRFGFRYRFEAFVPAAKRAYGYYVLPVLDGDRIVARVDARLDRAAGELLLRGPWWEPGRGRTRAERNRLEAAAGHFAAQCGAAWWTLETP